MDTKSTRDWEKKHKAEKELYEEGGLGLSTKAEIAGGD